MQNIPTRIARAFALRLNLLAASALLLPAIFATAADSTWMWQGLDSATGGSWADPANWTPEPPSADTNSAVLPSVTQGTRVIALDAPELEYIYSLCIYQDGASGTNILNFAQNLALTKAGRANAAENSAASSLYIIRSNGAKHDQIVLNMNGCYITIMNSSGASETGLNIAGTVNMNADGSSLRSTFNGHAAFNIFGIVNVTAQGSIIRINGATGLYTTTVISGGLLNIENNGLLHIGVIGSYTYSTRSVNVNNSGGILIANNGELRLGYEQNPGGSGDVFFSNLAPGKISHAGTISMRPVYTVAFSKIAQISNTGEYTLSGATAKLMRLPPSVNYTNITSTIFLNNKNAIFHGATSEDILEFDEEVDEQRVSGFRRLQFTNDGIIEPGAGTAGAALTTIGALRLRDTDLYMSTNAIVRLDLAGAAEGEYDRLIIEAGATDPAGDGVLDFTLNGTTDAIGTLELAFSETAFERSMRKLPLITAGSIDGAFAKATLNGQEFDDAGHIEIPAIGFAQLDYTDTAVTISTTLFRELPSILIIK